MTLRDYPALVRRLVLAGHSTGYKPCPATCFNLTRRTHYQWCPACRWYGVVPC